MLRALRHPLEPADLMELVPQPGFRIGHQPLKRPARRGGFLPFNISLAIHAPITLDTLILRG
jgi:hypothetical protein